MDSILNELMQQWAHIEAFFAFDSTRLADTDMIIRLCLQGLLLGGSAFFSGSETALFSLSRLDLQKLRRERHRHSETLHALLDQPRRLIISILCGNELVNIASAANMTGARRVERRCVPRRWMVRSPALRPTVAGASRS